MQRILKSKDSVAQAIQAWQECTPKIIKQAKLEESMRIREKIHSLDIDHDDEHDDEHDGKIEGIECT